MNNLKHNIKYLTIITLALYGLISCEAPDPFEFVDQFTESGEIQYRGKMDSVNFFPGKNRIKFEGILSSDPLVNSYRIYWNNRNDSVVFNVDPSQHSNKVTQIIDNLEENNFNFEIVTFDAMGNSSVTVNSNSRTYGDIYQSFLVTRPITTIQYNVLLDRAVVQLGSVTSSGFVETIIEYTDSQNNFKQVKTSSSGSTEQIILENFGRNNSFKYRSSYLPEEESIDVIFSDFTEVSF